MKMFGNFFGIDNNSLPQKPESAGGGLLPLLQNGLLSGLPKKKTVPPPATEQEQRIGFAAPPAVGIASFDVTDIVRRHKRLSQSIDGKVGEAPKLR